MKKFFPTLFASGAMMLTLATSCATNSESQEVALKDVFKDKFLIGVAINNNQAWGRDSLGTSMVNKHFNAVVAENEMKCERIHPKENEFFWDNADRFVQFAEENGMFPVGHCLIWHSQCAPWFFVDDKGEQVDAETLKNRMRDHIYAVVGRYKGRIKGWDVVNEAIVEDGSYRNSKFYQILGEEFIPLAFQYAHEADPDAELYYNDYGMNVAGRRDAVVKMVNDLKSRGLRIDAIGMQGHMGLDYPTYEEFETSLKAFAGTGCRVNISEWDMSALPTLTRSANVSDTVAFRRSLNPYPDSLPAEVSAQWNERMAGMLAVLLRNADSIDRVIAWGVSDGDSWKNGWPVPGRKDYPLLIDRNYELKPFLQDAIANFKENK